MPEISQRQSFTEGFGEVLRSSAIFYVRQSCVMTTTISFMDYWKAKRGLDVAVVATVRAMTGRLISRNRLHFLEGKVINYQPNLGGESEGSVEIEILSTKNLVFPYPALMAIYETKETVSMVHSYARAYSRHEIEDGQTVTHGNESNWTMRDSTEARSFCIFHNGAREHPAQELRLTIRSAYGDTRKTGIEIGRLRPYESFKLAPSDHMPDLIEFLGNRPGQATLSFSLNESFPRMLVANESLDGADLQVTHSDFNFNVHKTDNVSSAKMNGHLLVPNLRGISRWVVVYPGQDPGQYNLTDGKTNVQFESGQPLEVAVNDGSGLFEFRKSDMPLPTRINTGIGCAVNTNFLPAEPSLGVMHAEVPPKRMTWGPCAVADNLQTDIVIHAYDKIFGPPPEDMKLCFRLYSACSHEYLERTIVAPDLDAFDDGVPLGHIFPDAQNILNGDFGYFTAYSEYGGLKTYVLMKRLSGSATLEHCF